MTYPTLPELAQRLEGIPDPSGTHPSGLPVIYPGVPSAALPAILITPDGWTLEQNGKLIREHYEVKAAVARGNQPAEYANVSTVARAVLDRLVGGGGGFTLGSPITFEVGAGPPQSTDPPYLAHVIPVSFIAGGICAPSQTDRRLRVVDPDPDPDPD